MWTRITVVGFQGSMSVCLHSGLHVQRLSKALVSCISRMILLLWSLNPLRGTLVLWFMSSIKMGEHLVIFHCIINQRLGLIEAIATLTQLAPHCVNNPNSLLFPHQLYYTSLEEIGKKNPQLHAE